jgi:hypothetical protein
MVSKKIIGGISFAGFALIVAVGCGGTDETASDTTSSTAEDLSAKAMLACSGDADCTAIEAPACCPNGMKVAVNKHHVKAYENAHKCVSPPHVCPLFLIDDTRVSQCSAKGACEMVAP